jgi:arsenate reductase
LVVRNLIKEPLTEAEVKRLGRQAGGLRNLVAPKRRAEAEAVPDAGLAAWLAGDGGRVRRPIVAVDGQVTLGFAGDARAALEALLLK